MAAIPSENGDFVRWRLGRIKVDQPEKCNGSAARAASQRHTEQGQHKITAILGATTVCFHTDMDELIHAHPPREIEPDCTVAWWVFKAHCGARKAARFWQEYFRNDVFMRA